MKAEVVEEATDGKASNTGKGINSDSFKLGVLFRFVGTGKRSKEKSDSEG